MIHVLACDTLGEINLYGDYQELKVSLTCLLWYRDDYGLRLIPEMQAKTHPLNVSSFAVCSNKLFLPSHNPTQLKKVS